MRACSSLVPDSFARRASSSMRAAAPPRRAAPRFFQRAFEFTGARDRPRRFLCGRRQSLAEVRVFGFDLLPRLLTFGEERVVTRLLLLEVLKSGLQQIVSIDLPGHGVFEHVRELPRAGDIAERDHHRRRGVGRAGVRDRVDFERVRRAGQSAQVDFKRAAQPLSGVFQQAAARRHQAVVEIRKKRGAEHLGQRVGAEDAKASLVDRHERPVHVDAQDRNRQPLEDGAEVQVGGTTALVARGGDVESCTHC